MRNLQCLVWWQEGCLSRSATPELSRVVRTFDRCSCRGHFNLPCLWDFACSFDDCWCEVRFGPNTNWKKEDFHNFRARANCWSSQKPVSIGDPADALSGKRNWVNMARLRPEEVQHNQSSKYCTQKAFAARHESPTWLRFVQGFFARLWFCLPAYLAHCMHICWCNAACHHQGSSHIRKRCGTCIRRFGLQRELFWCLEKARCCFYGFNLCFVFALMAKVTAFYVTLPLVAVAALLHFPVAWLIQRLYRRTLFSEALDEYRKQINCKPPTGTDATHPRNQGLQVLNLRGLWKHFESFSLLWFCRAPFVFEGVVDWKHVLTWFVSHFGSE